MRQSRFAFILVAVVLGLAAFVLSNCPSSGDGENLFIGTWVNSAYNGLYGTGSGPAAKQVIKGDGTVDQYDNVTDTVPLESGTWKITGQDGDIYYIEGTLPSEGTGYSTIRLTSTMFEGRYSDTDYPTSPDPPEFTMFRQ